jgi:very-short-patch-repair endonuclease
MSIHGLYAFGAARVERPIETPLRGRKSAAVDFTRVMARSKSDRSARAWALAERQHWIVTRRQLLGLGYSEEAIEHRVAKGRLHRVRRGIYAVGRPDLTRTQQWMAAIQACGEEAALSHRSAAALWEIAKERDAQVDVSVRRRCERLCRGIRARSRPSLEAEDIVLHQGIPVTRPARTLLDLATELDPRALERAVNEADKKDLVDPEVLRITLEDFAGEPGVRALRQLLDRHTFRLSDSDLEVLFRPITAAARLPPPRTKAKVNGFEVDFYWPDLGLVIETDGLRYHRTPTAQARDRLRDQAHTAAGLTSLRFTHRQVKYERPHVQGILARTVARLRSTASEVSRVPGR